MIEFEHGALPYKPVTTPSADGVAHVYTLVHAGRGPRQVAWANVGVGISCRGARSGSVGERENWLGVDLNDNTSFMRF